MNNSEYWRSRASELENIQHSYSQEAYAEIEKIFINAQRDTQKEIEAWYGRLAKNNQVSITEARKLLSANELAEFKWDVKEYIKYGKENAINKAWIKELENASAKYHISRLEALQMRTQQYVEKAFGNELDVVDTLIKKSYTDGYYRTMFDIQKGFNVGFDVSGIDEKALKNIVGKPWALDGKNFSDRIWASKQDMINELHSQLTRTCVLGKSPDGAINAISKKFDVSKNRARTLVQTEQAYFSSVAREDAFKELDVEEYEILARLDSRTSNECQELDNKVFSMNDFEVGVTAPPFHPNCRSTTIPYFDDEYGVGKRAARGEDGKTCYFDSDMSYEDWKKGFVDRDKSGIIEVDNRTLKFRKFLESQKGIKDEYSKEIIKRFSNGSITAQDVFLKRVPDNSVVDTKYLGTAHYETHIKRIKMDFDKDLNNPKGKGVTYFHEHGHLIDWSNGTPVSIDAKFISLLHEDYNNYVTNYMKANNIKLKSDAYRNISKEIASNGLSSVSDLFGGLSAGKCQGSWGHERKYWEQDSRIIGIEAFAHFYEAQFDKDRLLNLNKYFPKTSEAYIKILEGF